MDQYLIEFRFSGKAKHEIKRQILCIHKKFNLGYTSKKRPVPHITLAGPIQTHNESRLINDFRRLCEKTPVPIFKINGYDFFNDTRVVYINIEPDKTLDNFRWNLSKSLCEYCNLSSYDYHQKFEYHATLAFKLDRSAFERIKKYVVTLKKPKKTQFLLRVTLLKNSKILYEYDFMQRKMLNRQQALSRREYEKTMKLMHNFFNGEYDPNRFVRSFQERPRQIAAIETHEVTGNDGILGLFIRKVFKIFRF